MKKNILFLSSLLMTISLNGMLVTRAAKLTSKRSIAQQRRPLSFVQSNSRKDLLVEYYRDFTDKELENSEHIKVVNRRISHDPLIIKFDKPSQEEAKFRNATYENSCVSFIKSYRHLSPFGRIIAFFTENNVYCDYANFAHKDSVLEIARVMEKSYLPKEEVQAQFAKIISKAKR